jgi:DNA-binding CsgD family transcriptional regulator
MEASEGGDVILFSEQQLVLRNNAPVDDARPASGRQPAIPNLVAHLLAAESPEQRESVVRGALQSIGFDWFAYGTVAHQRGASATKSFFTTYSHTEWTHRYFTERYSEIDPRHLDAPRSSLPLVWDIHDIDARMAVDHIQGRARHFADDFRDSGIGSGVFFHLASPNAPNERVVISLMSSANHRSWIVDRVLGQALTFGLCMHEFLSRHVEPIEHAPPAAESGLSALQRDILQCLSRGQSDKEIAYRLQLSSHAVDYHMRQLRRRFAARNRVQLVNAATA